MSEAVAVWAPFAKRVELALGQRRESMTARDGGWFESPTELSPGTDYAFCLDGGGPLPDPRSRHQPHGVHGASRIVDPERFSWTDQGFVPAPLSDAVIYELHVGTFSPEGTFDGVAARLDHLVELGATHVELMPVNACPGARNWGYDGVQLFAPMDAYGGPDGLARLVDACHGHGLAVLMDVVYNHLGPEGNYLGQFGPYFIDRYATPWGPAVNFDGAGSDEVRRFVCDNALCWLRDYHIDGLRIDAVHAILDMSAVHVLEQLASEVEEAGRRDGKHYALIAESDLGDPRIIAEQSAGGLGMDAQWCDDLHHAIHAAVTGEREGYYQDFGPLSDVAGALTRGYVFDGRYSSFRGRRHGRPLDPRQGSRLLAYQQTHDQVGNRARGERLGHLASAGLAKVGAALVATSAMVPMLFMGEEWCASSPFQYFTDHGDPGLAEAVRTGRRREFAAFGWQPEDVPDPQAVETFERSRLRWDERKNEPHASVQAWYRELLGLRHARPELRDGRLDGVHVDVDEKARWIRVERGPFVVACNLAEVTQTVGVPGETRLVLASEPGIRVDGQALELPPESVAILEST